MRFWLVFLLALCLSACASPASLPASEDASSRAGYPDLGSAPELTGNAWLNTSTPLRLSDFRGKVVLVNMWTFG